MKEFFQLLFKFDFKSLFVLPTDNGLIKFFRYCFVGGVAFVVDYAVFAVVCILLGKGNIITVIATTAGFIVGLIVNFLLTKKFVFTENANCKTRNIEFIWYTVIGLVGWGLNVLLMLVCTDWVLDINRYAAKFIVAAVILIYNYTARKIILYSNKNK